MDVSLIDCRQPYAARAGSGSSRHARCECAGRRAAVAMPPARLALAAPINGNVWIMSKHVVATVGEIPPGQRKLVTIRGRQIAVFNLDGEFFGLFNRCPHQGGPMCEGILTGLIESDRTRRLPLLPQGRDPALPVARLGIRRPHRPELLRPVEDQRAQLPGGGGRRASASCRGPTWPRPSRSPSRSSTSSWRCSPAARHGLVGEAEGDQRHAPGRPPRPGRSRSAGPVA